MAKHTDIAEVYLHINNGGISFKVMQATHEWDFDGEARISKAPVLEISANHFAQQTNNMQIQLSPEALRTLGEAFIAASEKVVVEDAPMLVENPRYIKYGNEMITLGLPDAMRLCSESEG